MNDFKHIAVIDIGKTNAKLVLVNAVTLEEVGVKTISNDVINSGPYPHYDITKIWKFLLESLSSFQKEFGISAISITSHGAAVALLDRDGELAAPILDYEYDWPEKLVEEYDEVRPSFAETGSPRLSAGLNIGAQLYYQFKTIDGLQDRTAKIVTYAQYWAHALTGVAACEVTSLGCHSDLWDPHNSKFSSLVSKLGWLDKFAKVKPAHVVLGGVTTSICELTGLKKGTPVYCGIHDSNASLYPYLQSTDKNFSVVSTGTWVIAMSVGGNVVELNENQDTLINVNAHGDKVPSARFMGGREYEILMNGFEPNYTQEDIQSVLAKKIMIMPAVVPTTGPFQNRQMTWRVGCKTINDNAQINEISDLSDVSDSERAVAVSFYLAMMTSVCLRITGANGVTYLEGPMSKNNAYKQMLEACTGRTVISSLGTGTSAGAAMLCGVGVQDTPAEITAGLNDNLDMNPSDKLMRNYCEDWHNATEE